MQNTKNSGPLFQGCPDLDLEKIPSDVSADNAIRRAVLGRAILDLAGEASPNPEDVRSAWAWIFKPDKASNGWPYSFVEICECLSVDPKIVRGWVLEHKGKRFLCAPPRATRSAKKRKGS